VIASNNERGTGPYHGQDKHNPEVRVPGSARWSGDDLSATDQMAIAASRKRVRRWFIAALSTSGHLQASQHTESAAIPAWDDLPDGMPAAESYGG
jgi:hypothetical protein